MHRPPSIPFRKRKRTAVPSVACMHVLPSQPPQLIVNDTSGGMQLVDLRVLSAATRNNTNAIRCSYPGHNNSHRRFRSAISDDGHTLAAVGADKRVRMWQVTTGRLLFVSEEFEHQPVDVALLGFNSIRATGSPGGTSNLLNRPAVRGRIGTRACVGGVHGGGMGLMDEGSMEDWGDQRRGLHDAMLVMKENGLITCFATQRERAADVGDAIVQSWPIKPTAMAPPT